MLLGVVSIDTGISTPDWFEFIQDTASKHQWRLEVYKTPAKYDDLVLKYGFPGPGKHGMFMNYLKGRAIRQFAKRHPDGILASGVRSAESNRRFISAKKWGFFEGVPCYAPLCDWTTETVWRYFNSHGFERSPAYQSLCISGDCLCGAFATKLERAAIRAFYPTVNERLARLEKLTGKQWGWGAFRSRRKRSLSPVCADCESPELSVEVA